MKLGIRVKFAGILVLATVLPIAAGLVAINILGYKGYREAEGKRFQGQAEQMADFLELTVNTSVRNLHDWLILSDLHERLSEVNAAAPSPDSEAFAANVLEMEALWPGLTPEDPELDAVLTHDLAADLRKFQSINPNFAEIFVTGATGTLVATTNKTTDYWQANERWWQKGWRAGFQSAHIEGINYDASAGVYSIDLAIPIRNPLNPEAEPAGVAKAVVQASDLFFDLAIRVSADQVRWKCILKDGRILFALDRPPMEERVGEQASRTMAASSKGWLVGELMGDDRVMAGFTRLPWQAGHTDREPDLPSPETLRHQIGLFADSELAYTVLAQETEPFYLLVHAPAAEVFAPVREQLRNITLAGILFVVLSTAAGFSIARTELIRPIRLLQNAAKNIATTARLTERDDKDYVPATALPTRTRRALDRVRSIHSTDELGDLSRDFEAMANRVLQYNEHLKADLKAKTREIQKELDLAREFQEALMPRSYPAVPSSDSAVELRLKFHHLYLPASTVGGDFFNIIKLDENRAGIFIADVMGHGARSALVTAIVGTLLQDFATAANDPAKVIRLMNEHFLNIMRHCQDFVFVSAFYMIVDTRKREVVYSAGGHPAPLRADRRTGQIEPLYPATANGSALGLLPDSEYSNTRIPLQEDTLFFLFTDGIVEAVNSGNQEFGYTRLQTIIQKNLHSSLAAISESVLRKLVSFTQSSAFLDDICFVSVGVEKNEFASLAVAAPEDPGHQGSA